MDLDGDTYPNDSLGRIWGADEEKAVLRKSSNPPIRSIGFLLCLAAGIGGLQFIFAIFFANGSAYLSSLGLTKPALALVWTSGPIAGMVVQPYLGIYSDRCRSSWGRRRPFIAASTLACLTCLIGLALIPVASVAVVLIVTLNVAIQPLQGGLRALLAESCPRQQHPVANGIAGAMVSVANVVGYALNIVDLRPLMGLGSQFSGLCLLTTVAMGLPVMLTCLVAQEPIPEHDDISVGDDDTTMRAHLWYLITSYARLPQQVQQVCKVQFLSWMGWFTFLFYVATYIGDNYKQAIGLRLDQSQTDDLDATAARIGSYGLLFFALVALIAGILLPVAHERAMGKSAESEGTSFAEMLVQWPGSIRRIWMASQGLFAICMLATMFVSSPEGVYILVALSGISWAVTIWAPYTVISAHISLSGDDGATTTLQSSQQPLMDHGARRDKDDDCATGVDGFNCAPDRESMLEVDVEGSCERRAGVVFGLHNAAIAGPQVLAAAGCSLIFWLADGSSQDGVGWALMAGGLTALGAVAFAMGIQDSHS